MALQPDDKQLSVHTQANASGKPSTNPLWCSAYTVSTTSEVVQGYEATCQLERLTPRVPV